MIRNTLRLPDYVPLHIVSRRTKSRRSWTLALSRHAIDALCGQFAEQTTDRLAPRMADWGIVKKKNPRKNEGILVAGTGFEPVTFGL